MDKCVLCKNTGRKRKFFIEDQLLCDSDYMEYLEFLIDDINGDVTMQVANKALTKLKISRRTDSSNTYNSQSSTRKRRRR